MLENSSTEAEKYMREKVNRTKFPFISEVEMTSKFTREALNQLWKEKKIRVRNAINNRIIELL